MVVVEPQRDGEVVREAFAVPSDALYSEAAFEVVEEEGQIAQGIENSPLCLSHAHTI